MITFQSVSYRYPEASRPALSGIDLHIPAGSFALVIGASGSGKSTLLRCLNGLVPHFSGGELRGQVRVCGRDPVAATPSGMSRVVGFVAQDPEAQAVMDRVEDEVAFALEQAGLARPAMRVRIEETLGLLDLTGLRERALDTLSGGERQRVAIAAALVLQPRVLVLDEPTSQLDPQSAEDVLQALVRLNHDLGLTVVLAEHRLERVLPFCDQAILLPTAGPGAISGAPADVLTHTTLAPPVVRLSRALGWTPPALTVRDARRHAAGMLIPTDAAPTSPVANHGQPPVLLARAVTAGYGGRTVLRDAGLAVCAGEIVALLGRNGVGKSTLLKLFAGLVRPRRGQVLVGGHDIAGEDVATICRRVAYLPQDPNALLFAEHVADELAVTRRNHGLPADPARDHAVLERLGIAQLADAYPRDLSAGERQRVALAAVTVTEPPALLLDEPTRGLDYAAKQALIELLRAWRATGAAVLLVTHDVEAAAAVADRVVVLGDGSPVADGDPRDVLGSSALFAPQIARVFPGVGWLTPEEVVTGLARSQM